METIKIQHVNDGYLSIGEGTTENISEFQVGIEPTTTVTPVKGSSHWATGTPGEGGLLHDWVLLHTKTSVLLVLEGSGMWP